MKNSPKPFVILTMVRCGSYYLSSLLDSAHDVCCFGEIYKKQLIEMPEQDLNTLGLSPSDVRLRNQLGETFLEYVVGLNPRKTTGFKAFLDHFDAAKMPEFPSSNQWRKVFLTRNVVEQYVSLERAKQTGIFTYFEGDEIESSVLNQKISIDFNDFQTFVEYRRTVDLAFARLKRKCGPNGYESIEYDDLHDLQKLQKLLKYIGSTARSDQLTCDRRKQFLRPLRDGIENFEEFKTYLDRSGQQSLLPSFYPPFRERLKKIWQRKQAA